MKKILMVLLLLLLTIGCSCNNDNGKEITKQKDPSELKDGELLTLYGRVSSYWEGDLAFTLVDDEIWYTIFIDGDVDIENGDYVKATGTWLEGADALESDSVKRLTEAEKKDYFISRFTYFEIEITDYTKKVNHTCETPKFTLNFINSGNEVLKHEDLHDYDYKYALFYFIDDNRSRATGDREDYREVYEATKNDQVGLINNQGFIRFDDINPGSTRSVEYWAGGQITRTEMGTAGSPNIFGNYSIGEYEVRFGWALKNNYDPIFLYVSDPVNVELLSEQCVLN